MAVEPGDPRSAPLLPRFDPDSLAHWLAAYLVYGLLYLLLRELGTLWRADSTWSFWFPPAGLRFAFLWRTGPRHIIPLALVEVLTQVVNGRVDVFDPDWVMVGGYFLQVLVCGLVIHLAKRLTVRSDALSLRPIPASLAAVLVPVATGLVVGPLAMLRGDYEGEGPWVAVVTMITGNLLGVVLIAFPLLVLSSPFRLAALRDVGRLRVSAWIEIAAVVVVSWATTLLIFRIGFGFRALALILGVAWIGIRFGQAPVWVANFFNAATTLALTAGATDAEFRIAAHLGLATAVIVGHLVGGFLDAERGLRAELVRRDRLLMRADRLKTMRAMSLSVIHEVAQPISTMVLESRRLARAAERRPVDPSVREGLDVLVRTGGHLQDIFDRLRRFGEAGEGRSRRVAARQLMEEAARLAAPEIDRHGRVLTLDCPEGAEVRGDPIELTQVLLNLLRNAIVHSDSREIRLFCETNEEDWVSVGVENRVDGAPRDRGGLGIGLAVARMIAEANRGRLVEADVAGENIRYAIQLPVVDDD